jgi:hypothetical protein
MGSWVGNAKASDVRHHSARQLGLIRGNVPPKCSTVSGSLFMLNGIPKFLIKGSRSIWTHSALAHLATAEIDLCWKVDPRHGLVGDH